jgi:hypothetical protein
MWKKYFVGRWPRCLLKDRLNEAPKKQVANVLCCRIGLAVEFDVAARRRGTRLADVRSCARLRLASVLARGARAFAYHICSSKTVLHTIYHDADRPSHLLLPVVATDPHRN